MPPQSMPWKWCVAGTAGTLTKGMVSWNTCVLGWCGICPMTDIAVLEKGKTMADTKLLELPYEKIAMSGGEMPIGLDYPDQILFLELRLLYDSYKKKMIDRETATREKVELLRTYEGHKAVESMGKLWVEQIKKTELFRADYRKNRTLENADRLLKSIEGGK